MPRVVHRFNADRDLRAIWFSISPHDPRAADRLLRKIDARLASLAEQPLTGRPRPDLMRGLRSVPVKPYTLYYRPMPDGVELVRVLHGRRHAPSLFGDA